MYIMHYMKSCGILPELSPPRSSRGLSSRLYMYMHIMCIYIYIYTHANRERERERERERVIYKCTIHINVHYIYVSGVSLLCQKITPNK